MHRLDVAARAVTAKGNRITAEDVRVWVVRPDGMTFGSGWRSGHDETGD